MPTRIVREGILDSDAVNQLSDRAEIFYRRLMSVVDDYGRFDGRLVFLRVRVFPLQLDRWPLADVEEALEECSSILLSNGDPLVTTYEVEGRPYVQINNFGQRQRSASKFPAPDGSRAGAPAGKVYFILATESKRIKIGYTEWKPESRMGSLQVGMPEKLELLGWMEGSRADEATIQRQFAHLQSVGEWFDDNADLRAFIDDKTQRRTMPHNAAHVVATRGRGRSESESESESYAESKSESLKKELPTVVPKKPPTTKALVPNRHTFGEFGKVRLSEAEHESLVAKLGHELTATYIEALDGWIAERPNDSKRKNRDCKATILNWHRRDVAEGRNRQPKPGANNGKLNQHQRREADRSAILEALAETGDDSDGPEWIPGSLPGIR